MAKPNDEADLAAVCGFFPFAGPLESGAPHGSGHINDTFAVACAVDGRTERYLLQRINGRVFRDVPALMENIRRVCAHLAERRAPGAAGGHSLQPLKLIPTRTGAAFHLGPQGDCWRAYEFISGARTRDQIVDAGQAETAARAFGEFQRAVADLPGRRLHETIPHFHDTPRRFAHLRRAIAADAPGRAGEAASEVSFALAREGLAGVLARAQAEGSLPERVAHNDAKIGNVMIDDVSGRAVSVIDLDTVMPGLGLCDFADLVRSGATAAAEDETELARVRLRLPFFAALVRGYLAGTDGMLQPAERGLLAASARVITFEQGLRFLTDHLEGDVYYKVAHPGHNLERARNQFALVREMEAHADEMEAIVRAGGN